MVNRAKSDPEYASLVGGILAGLISPTRGMDAYFMISTAEEAAVSTGLRIIGDAISDPSTLPETAVRIIQTPLEVVASAVQDPFGFLQWSMDTATKMAEVATTIPRQMLDSYGKQKENR